MHFVCKYKKVIARQLADFMTFLNLTCRKTRRELSDCPVPPSQKSGYTKTHLLESLKTGKLVSSWPISTGLGEEYEEFCTLHKLLKEIVWRSTCNVSIISTGCRKKSNWCWMINIYSESTFNGGRTSFVFFIVSKLLKYMFVLDIVDYECYLTLKSSNNFNTQ